MRRHARVDVLSIVTFNYLFRGRDDYRRMYFVALHKYDIFYSIGNLRAKVDIVSLLQLLSIRKSI